MRNLKAIKLKCGAKFIHNEIENLLLSKLWPSVSKKVYVISFLCNDKILNKGADYFYMSCSKDHRKNGLHFFKELLNFSTSFLKH